MQLNEMAVALGVPMGAFFMAVAVVGLVGYFKNLERARRSELVRLALEKGQAIPAALLDLPGPAGSELAGGIKTVFAGLGLGVFLWIFKPETPLWAVGLMVVLFGVGKLVAHAVTSRQPPPGRPTG